MESLLEANMSWDISRVTTEVIDTMPFEKSSKFAVLLHNVLSKEECEKLIEESEKNGYEQALVNIGGGRQKMMSDVRNSDRTIIDDATLAEKVWQRIRRILPENELLMRAPWARKDINALGLNERLRFLRYDPGCFFAPHFDGSYKRNTEAGLDRKGETSYVTCQIYLNEGFEGGATRMMDVRNDANGHDVVPRAGSVLLFRHDICHEGSVLVHGRKYTIRTDVMYGTGSTYAENPIPLTHPTDTYGSPVK